jgi:hypothetical protein
MEEENPQAETACRSQHSTEAGTGGQNGAKEQGQRGGVEILAVVRIEPLS